MRPRWNKTRTTNNRHLAAEVVAMPPPVRAELGGPAAGGRDLEADARSDRRAAADQRTLAAFWSVGEAKGRAQPEPAQCPRLPHARRPSPPPSRFAPEFFQHNPARPSGPLLPRQLRGGRSAHIVANQARNRVATRQAKGHRTRPAFRVPEGCEARELQRTGAG